MRRALVCLGMLLSIAGLTACGGGGGDASSASSGGGGGGGTTLSGASNIVLPSSVQVVTATSN